MHRTTPTLDPAIPAAADPPDLPEAVGIVRAPLMWWPDRDYLTREVAEARIHVCCPFCGGTHIHGWRLDGRRRRSEERVAHCARGHYHIVPAPDRALHEFAPAARRVRRAAR